MNTLPIQAVVSGENLDVLLAGQKVPPGVYLDVEIGREVVVEDGGVLPARCDGRVAVYMRRPLTFGELRDARSKEAA